MKRLRIYADTSVIGGCLDTEFAFESQRFIEVVRKGQLTMLVSEIVLQELQAAPEQVQAILLSLPPTSVERVHLTTEIIELRNAYLKAGILHPQWENDATHVAAATIARADAIVSWNFKHIVRLDKMKAYNQINLLQGYGILTIVSPKEVIIDDNGNTGNV